MNEMTRIISVLVVLCCSPLLGGCPGSPEPSTATQAAISRSWRAAAQVDNTSAAYSTSTKVALSATGDGLAVWDQWDGTSYNIYASHYDRTTGWSAAVLLENTNQNAFSSVVAMDASGNGLAVWHQYDGTRYNIWAVRYDAAIGWGTAAVIESGNGHALYPALAMDSNGNTLAVWRQYDGSRWNIGANAYSPTTGWGMDTLIETDNAGSAVNPRVAIGAGGNGLAVWQQYDGTRYNIWANSYSAATGWGTAALIETEDLGNAMNVAVSMNGQGDGVATWNQYDGTRWRIWGNRYDRTAGWGTATSIEQNTGDAFNPTVGTDSTGNAIVLWQQFDGTQNNLWGNRYDRSTGWGTPSMIESEPGDVNSARVALDGSGNALAVWNQYDGTRYNIWTNRYQSAIGWGTAELLEDEADEAESPDVSVNASGDGLAVWIQTDGAAYHVQARAYR